MMFMILLLELIWSSQKKIAREKLDIWNIKYSFQAQFDHGMFKTIFRYRTWNFRYLCNFSSAIQWSGPNIQVLLCKFNKNEKKTKLPGKTSWKVSIWHFVLYELVFNRKIQFATLKILVAFFSPKSFKPIFSGSVCWILDFFGLNKQNHQKTILFQVSTVLFWLVFVAHVLLFADALPRKQK